MNIWMIRFDIARYAGVFLLDRSGNPLEWYEDWPHFEGQKIGEHNFNFNAKFDLYRPNKVKDIGNFVYCDPGALMCDYYAFVKLKPYINREIEVLSMNVEGLTLKVLNVINVVDCLDRFNSKVSYFDGSQNVMSIEKYIFNTELLKNIGLFKIPQMARTEIFATDTVRDQVLEYQLTGLEFRLAYSD